MEMYCRWSIVSKCFIINLALISFMFIQLVQCKSTLSSITNGNDQVGNLIKSSAVLLKNHLIDQATSSSRATTSSQVIEYNARNIVLMTLLNSVLILGGLLGTMNRPDVSPMVLPFKRIDLFNGMKKRFWNKRSRLPNNRNNNNDVHMHNSMANIPIESIIKDLNILRLSSNKPMMTTINNELLHPNTFESYEIYPRMLVQHKSNERRHDDDHHHVGLSSSSLLTPGESLSSTVEDCALIIQCTDTKGKHYYPSLSLLTKTVVQLLNEDNHHKKGRKKSKSLMLDKVKEMVEIEQKNTCQWKHICQAD